MTNPPPSGVRPMQNDVLDELVRAILWTNDPKNGQSGMKLEDDEVAVLARHFTTAAPAEREEGARIVHECLSRANITAYLEMPANTAERVADTILAKLQPSDRADQQAAAGDASEEVDLKDGEWFYPEGDHSSDECRLSPDEVIDYALEGEAASRVVCIERAVSLSSVYAAVRVWSDAEKDERQSDDDYGYTLHATAEEARAALRSAEA